MPWLVGASGLGRGSASGTSDQPGGGDAGLPGCDLSQTVDSFVDLHFPTMQAYFQTLCRLAADAALGRK